MDESVRLFEAAELALANRCCDEEEAQGYPPDFKCDCPDAKHVWTIVKAVLDAQQVDPERYSFDSVVKDENA